MRIPTLGALTLAAAAAVVVVPTTANAAAPTAAPDSTSTNSLTAKTINVLTNDSGDAGKTLTVTDKTNGAHGTVACTTAGACTYTPAAAWAGLDSFTYTVSDGTLTSTGTVNVTTRVGSLVANVPDASLTWPQEINVTGIVKDKNGTVIPGYTLKLLAKPFGSTTYSQVGATQTTSSLGKVALSVQPTRQTTYKWSHDDTTNSLTKTVTVAPLVAAGFAPKSVAVGDTTTVTGTATPVASGDTVGLERRNANGTWTTVRSFTFTTSSSATDVAAGAPFTFEIPADAGVNIYRVTRAAGNGLVAAHSAQATLKGYDAKIAAVVPTNADEYVSVKNNGTVAFNLKNWILTDTAVGGNSATLPDKKIEVGQVVKIHSGTGKNNLNNVYLKGANLWDNSGTLELTDSHEFMVDDIVYP